VIKSWFRKRRARAAWLRLGSAHPLPEGEIVITTAAPESRLELEGVPVVVLLGFHARGIVALSPAFPGAVAIAPGDLVAKSPTEFRFAGTGESLEVRRDVAELVLASQRGELVL